MKLRHLKTGRLFGFTPLLAKRSDMELVLDEGESAPAAQPAAPPKPQGPPLIPDDEGLADMSFAEIKKMISAHGFEVAVRSKDAGRQFLSSVREEQNALVGQKPAEPPPIDGI